MRTKALTPASSKMERDMAMVKLFSWMVVFIKDALLKTFTMVLEDSLTPTVMCTKETSLTEIMRDTENFSQIVVTITKEIGKRIRWKETE